MKNKEEMILEELMDAINNVMVCFDEKEATQQKKEQQHGLDIIESEYKNKTLKNDTLYFIGRFKIVRNLENKLPADYRLFRQNGYDMLRMSHLKNIIEQHISDLIGVSGVDIERSRNESMVKVFISGAAIHQYIAMGLKLDLLTFIAQEDAPLAGLFNNINNTMIYFSEIHAPIQNAEQSRGLSLIKSHYLEDEIEDTQEYFIGRYRTSYAKRDTLVEDIAQKIGVSSVQIAPSRDVSMVKVFIKGDVLQQYIAEKSPLGLRF